MPVKVSVVVPVWNPGSNIDDLVASLLRQSLPLDEFEAVFVDDGSTDGTGERLDALAARHRHFRVFHIPNSGWPGRPRNVGIDGASGEYVYFVDNDDWIGDEALERLYAMAERNGSDVVLGKMAGHGRPVPSELFRASRDRATLHDFPALLGGERARGDPLTPHKLFRKAFLDEHGIRFPEGRRRLEDHVFVMNAYFRARVISVVADYVCYHFARRGANASRRRFDPRGYYDNLREVLDIVEEHTEPGPFRDRLLRHWYQQKLLDRAGGRALLGYPPDYRGPLVSEIRRLALERFGPGVTDGLPANLRVRSALLRAGDLERLIALARVESAIKSAVRLEDVRWESGRLVVRVHGRLVYGDGTPLAFARDDETLSWNPPVDLGPHVSLDDRKVTNDVASGTVDLLVRSRGDGGEFLLPAHSTITRRDDGGSATVSLVAEAGVDPPTSAAGNALGRDTWDVGARVRIGGWVAPARVGSDRSETIPRSLRPALLGDPVRVVIPYWTLEGNLSVDVDQSRKSLAASTTPEDAHARLERSAVVFALAFPGVVRSPAAATPVEIHAKRMGSPGRTVTVPATLSTSEANGSTARLEAVLPVRRVFPTSRFISPGSWALSATIGPATKSLGLVLDVEDDGTVSVRSAPSGDAASQDGALPAPLAERVLYAPSWRRRVPPPIRRGMRAVLQMTDRLPVSPLVPRKR